MRYLAEEPFDYENFVAPIRAVPLLVQQEHGGEREKHTLTDGKMRQIARDFERVRAEEMHRKLANLPLEELHKRLCNTPSYV